MFRAVILGHFGAIGGAVSSLRIGGTSTYGGEGGKPGGVGKGGDSAAKEGDSAAKGGDSAAKGGESAAGKPGKSGKNMKGGLGTIPEDKQDVAPPTQGGQETVLGGGKSGEKQGKGRRTKEKARKSTNSPQRIL